MPQELGLVRFEVVGPMTARDLQFALAAVERCHDGLFLLDAITEELNPEGVRDRAVWWWGPRWFHLISEVSDAGNDFSRFVSLEAQVLVVAARFSSPGWLEIFGALNPLTQMRAYLQERHERKKDREYRNEQERERLELENERRRLDNESLRNRVLRDRIELLRSSGVPEPEINGLLHRLVVGPFSELARAQDSGALAGLPSDEDAA